MYRRLSLFLSLVSTVTACSTEHSLEDTGSTEENAQIPGESQERQVTSLTPQLGNVVRGNTSFAIDVYDVLSMEEGNIFFSPFSLSSALAMTYAGASGETAEQMGDGLRIRVNDPVFHWNFGMLTRDLDGDHADRGYTLQVANRLFGRVGYEWDSEFLRVNEVHYGAPLEELDFGGDPEGSRLAINDWVSEQTEDYIPELFPSGTISSSTALVLTNALYFAGEWESRFDADDTSVEDFTTPTGTVEVELMKQWGPARYASLRDVDVLELPYKSDELSMVIVLPHEVDGLREIEGRLSPRSITTWIDALNDVDDMLVRIPKLTLSTDMSLVPVLAELGMTDMVDSTRSDFSGMVLQGNGPTIDTVLQQTWITIDEEGTVAAAATGVGMSDGAEPAPQMFVADHPFLFLIRDRLTDSVLFMGRLQDPSL